MPLRAAVLEGDQFRAQQTLEALHVGVAPVKICSIKLTTASNCLATKPQMGLRAESGGRSQGRRPEWSEAGPMLSR